MQRAHNHLFERPTQLAATMVSGCGCIPVILLYTSLPHPSLAHHTNPARCFYVGTTTLQTAPRNRVMSTAHSPLHHHTTATPGTSQFFDQPGGMPAFDLGGLGGRGGAGGGGFEETYRAYSLAMAGRQELESGGKSA